jgi:hypothetical protein
MTDQHWRAIESGLVKVGERMLALLPAERVAALCEEAIIDLDTADVQVYGLTKDNIAYNHQGQRVGRPHVAGWAETPTVLAADLGCGLDDPRATVEDLLQRALAGPAPPTRPRGHAGAVPAPVLDGRVENILCDSKHGAALRHLPSGNEQVNNAWMWGALPAP